MGYSGRRIYSGIGEFFVCQTNDYSWYSGYSDALAVCYTNGSADFFVSRSNFSNENCRLREEKRSFKMTDMAGMRAILLSVCTEELAEYEHECETDSDMVEKFLPFFLLEDKLKSRERVVRIWFGFAEEVVPNYSRLLFVSTLGLLQKHLKNWCAS